jgi:hypothetical protein
MVQTYVIFVVVVSTAQTPLEIRQGGVCHQNVIGRPPRVLQARVVELTAPHAHVEVAAGQHSASTRTTKDVRVEVLAPQAVAKRLEGRDAPLRFFRRRGQEEDDATEATVQRREDGVFR